MAAFRDVFCHQADDRLVAVNMSLGANEEAEADESGGCDHQRDKTVAAKEVHVFVCSGAPGASPSFSLKFATVIDRRYRRNVLNISPRSFVSHWVPAIAWMVLIFAGSTDVLSAEETSRFLVPFLRWLDPHMSFAMIAAIHMSVRKLGHVTEYAVLAALLWRVMRPLWPEWLWWPALASLGVCVVYAWLDEFHQSFVPSRTSSENDVMIDMFGAIAALVVCLAISQQTARQRFDGSKPT